MIKAICVGQAFYEMYVSVDTPIRENDRVRFVNKLGCGGGNAFNITCLLSKWGVRTSLLSVVGNDAYGNRLRKQLEDVGCDTRALENSYEKDTVLSMNIISPSRHTNTQYVLADEFCSAKKCDFDFMPDLIICDGEDSYNMKRILEMYKNATSIVYLPRYEQKSATYAFNAKYLICSVEFASTVTKFPVDMNSVSSLVTIYAELKKKYEHQEIIITLKDKGAMYMVGQQIKISPALKTPLVDRTGAGALFTGAFAYGIGNGFSVEQAIKYGNIASGLSLGTVGTSLAIPKLDEVQKIYEENN